MRELKYKQIILSGTLAILASCSALFGLSAQVLADEQKDLGLVLSPADAHLEIKANQSYAKNFKIRNSSSDEIHFKVYAAPYSVSGSNYEQNFAKETNYTQLSRWISFEQTEYALKANEEVNITYNVKTPNSIPAGGQYAAIFAETYTDENESSGVVINRRVGQLFYAKGDGETKEKAEILHNQINFLQTSQPLKATSQVKNGGNTDFSANIKLEVSGILGGKTYENTASHLILPETEREMIITWDNAPFLGIFNVKQTITALGETSEQSGLVFVCSPEAFLVILAVLLGFVAWKIYNRHQPAKNSKGSLKITGQKRGLGKK